MVMVPRKRMRSELYFTDRWVTIHEDAAGDVRYQQGVSLRQGSSSQDRVVPPAALSAVLDNRSGRYSRRDPLGPNYGKLGANQPMRTTLGLAADSFSRTVSSGWGTSENGDTWAIEPTDSAADYNVSAGMATHTIGGTASSRRSTLSAQLHRNVEVSTEFSLTVADVTGGALEPANLLVRRNPGVIYYMLRVVIKTDETITVKIMDTNNVTYGTGEVTVPGLTYSANTWYGVKLQAEGATLRGKVWAISSTVDKSRGEPLTWHVEAEVPAPQRGEVGVRSGVASGNTNVPVVFRYRNFEVRSPRFIGESAVMSPRWDPSESNRVAELTAAGITRRLSQGAPVLKSTLRRGIPTQSNLVQYWPMEDGTESTALASAIMGAPAMTVAGDFQLAAYDDIASSQAIPELGSCIFRGDVPTYTGTGEVQTRWIMHLTPNGLAENHLLHRTWVTGGTIAFFDISGGPTTGSLKFTVNTGTAEILNTTIGFDLRDRPGRFSLQLKQNGANIDYGLWFYEVGASGAGGATGTINNQTLGIAQRVGFSLTGVLDRTAIGHCTVEKAVTDIFALSAQLNAYNGETAMSRMARLCREEGVALSINGEYDPDALMGPQRPNTLLDLLTQCAEVDQGILGESRGTLGLKYRTRLSMINQPVAVTLDRSKGELSPPFEPTDDDRLTNNDITATRINGSSFQAEQTTGPMSVQAPPAGAGRYDTAPEFAAFWDVQLPHLANWLLALGTVDEYRYPTISAEMSAPDIAKNTQLVYDLLSLDVGDRLVVTGLAPIGIYDDVHQLVRGYDESMMTATHLLRANTFPYAPYRALVLDDAELGRADSDSSTVATGFSATAGSFSVATADPADLWTTDGADFPLDVMIAGERIRLSGITGASSPQTFTVASSGRSINGAGKAHVAGEAVHVFDIVRLA